MISPEGYYEMNLKDKTEKEIRSVIRGLKNEIGCSHYAIIPNVKKKD